MGIFRYYDDESSAKLEKCKKHMVQSIIFSVVGILLVVLVLLSTTMFGDKPVIALSEILVCVFLVASVVMNIFAVINALIAKKYSWRSYYNLLNQIEER